MEKQGLVERLEGTATGTVDYIRTNMVVEPDPVTRLLGEWACRNISADVALDDLNPDYLMWNVRRKVDPSALPTLVFLSELEDLRPFLTTVEK